MAIRALTQTTRLGRYEIVERLAEGGMADVLLARTVGIEGFERHVVLKRIRADQARDLRYVTMFLDEARLAASLHHANIVQVNDIGQEDGEYFFTMEYVHGEDVRTILRRAAETGTDIPLAHVLAIVMGAAAGLHHAHEQIRADGTSLGIVHRDVSPANILVGFDGGVKVADFGIAKAAHQTVETQSGVLKGKVAYMSPEQCNNEPVDRRSDVFSLGIVLYELLLLRPLFQRENDFLTMTAIVQHAVPRPSQTCPGIPLALEAVILKALARSPADRYATTDEMRRALEQVAHEQGLRMSTSGLADYMTSVFGVRREPWLAHRDVPVPADGAAADDELEIEVERSPTKETRSVRPSIRAAPPARAKRRWMAGAAAAVAVIGIAVSVLVIGRGDDARAARARTPAPLATAKPIAAPATVAPAGAPTAQTAEPAPTSEAATRGDEPGTSGDAPRAQAAVDSAPAPTAAKKRHRKATRPAKRWDPAALFPE